MFVCLTGTATVDIASGTTGVMTGTDEDELDGADWTTADESLSVIGGVGI